MLRKSYRDLINKFANQKIDMIDKSSYEDSAKRGRLLFLSLFILISVFVLKLFNPPFMEEEWSIYLLGFVYFVITYIGLIIAFKFQINKQSLLYVIPQSAVFVFSEIMFLELFFFRQFIRVYEAFLMVIVLILFVFGSYVSFLMANVFNVAGFKQIPLQEVAKTSSYVLSLLSVYFLTFAFLATNLHIALISLILLTAYAIITTLHIRYFKLHTNHFWVTLIINVWSMLFTLLPMLFLSDNHELLSLIPTAVMFAIVGIVMHKVQNIYRDALIVEYAIVIIVAYVLNFIFL